MTAQTLPLSATLALVCSFATNAAPLTEDSDTGPFCAITIEEVNRRQNQDAKRIEILSGFDDTVKQPAFTTADIIAALIASELDPPDFYTTTSTVGISDDDTPPPSGP
ncbi:hypothetical protein [Celeribacter halophilus]|uniref:Uncharacterized protein n=1 Tax=Celeribacter halophilus TaxID=576117 RepID=A0A1I3W600_9RHOB|nr:hypothetical protein [Celeribacter halophilus]PZX09901.1 hypothetical protein LX82_02715 [Celeribacter halophilus]SFK01851.1 hypothetical protein SAMN04488138_12017 [Celeribacter halophilus]